MNNLESSASTKPLVTARNHENTAVVLGAANSQQPMVRELSQLIADIRRARAVLDAAGLTDEPVRLEHVLNNDPRD